MNESPARASQSLREEVAHDVKPSTPLGRVLTPTQRLAVWYYDVLKLDVFPQPLGKKAGFPWKKLQHTRLH